MGGGGAKGHTDGVLVASWWPSSWWKAFTDATPADVATMRGREKRYGEFALVLLFVE